MNLTEIIANYRSLKRISPGDWGLRLTDILKALFERHIPDENDNVEYPSLIGVERIEIYSMLKLFHGDEQSTELHVLVVDGKPLGISYCFGRQWVGHIYDVEKYKELCREMAAILLEQQMEWLKPGNFKSLRDLQSEEIFVLGPKESMFAVHSPKGTACFEDIAGERKGYFVDEQCVAHPVEQILGFANTKLIREYTRDVHDVRVLIAGAERVVDGTQLMFEMVPGKGDIDDALKSYAKAPCWVVERVHAPANYAEVLVRRPGRWTTDTVGCQFETDADRERFEGTYFDHSKKEQIIAGDFDPVGLGFKAKLNLTQ